MNKKEILNLNSSKGSNEKERVALDFEGVTGYEDHNQQEKPLVGEDNNQERIQEIQDKIADISDASTKTSSESYPREQDAFLKHIPKYLEVQKKKGRNIYKFLELLNRRKMEIEGRENLPKEGPFLVISNHFSSDPASQFLLSTLADYDTHLVVSEDVHWRNALKRKWLEYLGTIKVPGTLSRLSSEQKASLRSRLPKGRAEETYTKILERDPRQLSKDVMRFVRSTAALLARGDVVAMYPEGHWLYDDESGMSRKEELYAGYRGIEVIAKQFKKYTGEDLPVVPVGIYGSSEKKQRVVIGEAIRLADNNTGLSDTDFAMNQLARLLPEENRGEYR